MAFVLTFLILIGSVGLAGAASIAVDPRGCSAIPANLLQAAAKIVGTDWPIYRPFMCVYPVKSPTGSTVLFLLALDTSKADAANSLVLEHGQPVPGDNDGGKNDPIPAPAVIDSRGNKLAEFPDSIWFPNNDPATISVFFSGWKNDFPSRFTLYVDDPTVSSPGWPYCPPPFIWNALKKAYVQAKGDFYAKCVTHP